MRETTKGSSSEFIGYRMPQHEQNWPPSVKDKISRFPGKSNSFQTSFLFLIAIAQWDVDEKDKTMSRAAKGKGESRGKNKKKTQNVLRSQATNRQTAFQITIRGNC